MNILTSLEELMPADVPALGDTQVTGGASVDYGSSVHFLDLLITDESGKPIPGVTVRSREGYVYPLDDRNGPGLVPEPATFALMAFGLAVLGMRRKPWRPMAHLDQVRDREV